MAEIGLVASIVGIAATGVQLSVTLFTFAETVSAADKQIKDIARDVSLTSSVLEELGNNLRRDEKAKLCSDKAIDTAKSIVRECSEVFTEINTALETSMKKTSASAKGATKGQKIVISKFDRLKWPFQQPKMELLRTNLERLKSTLLLMLNVLTYARNVRAEYARPLHIYYRLWMTYLL
jgi:hypothetical protein